MTDFSGKYNTWLSAENEKRFLAWVELQKNQRGRDVSQDIENYDIKGYWLNGGYKDAGIGHMTDVYKKPNHPTFSDQSKYNGVDGYKGGTWGGDDKTGWTFTPTREMLNSTHDKKQMQDYFRQQEPDTRLVFPQ